ncbi:hypothetical protein KCU67_g12, partial [Aureobasidium melanogenum]
MSLVMVTLALLSCSDVRLAKCAATFLVSLSLTGSRLASASRIRSVTPLKALRMILAPIFCTLSIRLTSLNIPRLAWLNHDDAACLICFGLRPFSLASARHLAVAAVRDPEDLDPICIVDFRPAEHKWRATEDDSTLYFLGVQL